MVRSSRLFPAKTGLPEIFLLGDGVEFVIVTTGQLSVTACVEVKTWVACRPNQGPPSVAERGSWSPLARRNPRGRQPETDCDIGILTWAR